MDDDPAYDISVSVESPSPAETDACVVGAVRASLAHYRPRAARISVVVVDDDAIRQLNERHLNRDEPTDVLAFDLRGETSQLPDSPPQVLVDGDIVVSVETARREAERRGHDLRAELALYVVHGTLHLLGHDDGDIERASRMHGIENEILTALGYGAVYGAPR